MCRCRHSRDVKVTDDIVAVVDVVIDDVVLIVVSIAAIAGDAKQCTTFFVGAAVAEEIPCGCQSVRSEAQFRQDGRKLTTHNVLSEPCESCRRYYNCDASLLM
jgi:hypothetical protein